MSKRATHRNPSADGTFDSNRPEVSTVYHPLEDHKPVQRESMLFVSFYNYSYGKPIYCGNSITDTTFDNTEILKQLVSLYPYKF